MKLLTDLVVHKNKLRSSLYCAGNESNGAVSSNFHWVSVVDLPLNLRSSVCIICSHIKPQGVGAAVALFFFLLRRFTGLCVYPSKAYKSLSLHTSNRSWHLIKMLSQGAMFWKRLFFSLFVSQEVDLIREQVQKLISLPMWMCLLPVRCQVIILITFFFYLLAHNGRLGS